MNKKLNKLINISIEIKKVYDKSLDDDKDYSEYLQFLLDEEKKIYESIELKRKEIVKICDVVDILVAIRDIDDELKTQVSQRIENYLSFLYYRYPFKSTSGNFKKDADLIRMQASIDFTKSLLYNLNNKLEKSNNKKEQRKIRESINNIIFINKEQERIDHTKLNCVGKDLCINLGHNESLVYNIYSDYKALVLNNAINACLTFTDSSLEKNKNNPEFLLCKTTLKSVIDILDKDEFEYVFRSFNNTFEASNLKSIYAEDSTISIKEMRKIFTDKEKEINKPVSVKQKKISK